ncbi:MAG TPA: type I-C CRISPR-associated endonuclease Cas1c [Sedimentisphaerales bacterium]|jgi:CRISPR-associated protein Cas1|nr:type I-C CRISPR-associated endonuclease Cas1c [Sedimentisphaerales bacterium]HNU29222.1 type I-C CRISPR-associated endonuclease Cas1c [Sedimentisphaerales bacterium]
MKRLLNTLFVTTQGAYLSKQGDTICVNVEQETKLRVPIHNLGSVVCFGNVGCSPFLMGFCGEQNVTLSFLSESGRFLARVHGPVSGNVLLRKEQYRRSDDASASALIARSLITAKLANSRIVLQRAQRDREDLQHSPAIGKALDSLWELIQAVKDEPDLDRIRGIEGTGANLYFSVFDLLIGANKEQFFFKERSRRPPLDNMNALLSFLYTLLVHDVESALEAVGLDPAVGFLHRDRPGRPSLALDLMEEFRAYLADRMALSLVHRQQIKPEGFTRTESGAVTMDDETRKAVLIAWQKRKQEEITHLFLQESVPLGLLPHIQAQLLARHLRGDLEGYPPFLWR